MAFDLTWNLTTPQSNSVDVSCGQAPYGVIHRSFARKPGFAGESKEARSCAIMVRLVVVVREPLSISIHLWVSFVRCSHGNLSRQGAGLCESTLLHFLVLPDRQAHFCWLNQDTKPCQSHAYQRPVIMPPCS